jgi:hypothetical protein
LQTAKKALRKLYPELVRQLSSTTMTSAHTRLPVPVGWKTVLSLAVEPDSIPCDLLSAKPLFHFFTLDQVRHVFFPDMFIGAVVGWCECVFASVCTCVYVCPCTCVYVCTCMYVCVYVCPCTRVYVCVLLCVCVCVCFLIPFLKFLPCACGSLAWYRLLLLLLLLRELYNTS